MPMPATIAPEVGDTIDVVWETEDAPKRNPGNSHSKETLRAKVVEKIESEKSRHGSKFKYKLAFTTGEIRETRLLHKDFSIVAVTPAESEPPTGVTMCERSDTKKKQKKKTKIKSEKRNAPDNMSDTGEHKKQKTITSATTSPINTAPAVIVNGMILPPHRTILAPMVGGSELAFRLLCRRYGTELAYTPMINSEKFVHDEAYRENEFQIHPQDRPLVVHFSANHPQTLLKAARLVQGDCDAIDLNLGCPQRIAHSGHFGSYLLGDEDRPLVLDIVRTVSAGIRIPMFVKIRLLNTLEETLQLCRQLVEAGASLIAIHGRYRVNLVGRSGPGARDGAAHLDQIKSIKEAITSIPIIANGNIITYDDVVNNLSFTNCNGVMSAEGILDNPSLYSPGKDSERPEKLQLALEYLALVDLHPVPLKSVIFHIRRICKVEFSSFQLLEDCLAAKSVSEIRTVVQQGITYSTAPAGSRDSFSFDPFKEKRRKLLLEQKKREEGKRKDYEKRMMRKSKREGRDINHYLNIGAANPTMEILESLRKLDKSAAFDIWKRDHSQHCYAHHFEEGGCKRDRTCAFLHSDVSVAEAVMYG